MSPGPDVVVTAPMVEVLDESYGLRRNPLLEPYGGYAELLVRTGIVRPEGPAPPRVIVQDAAAVARVLRPLTGIARAEHRDLFVVMCISGRNQVLGIHVRPLSFHTAELSPRQVLQPAFALSASAIILAHTHEGPSEPEPVDIENTQRLKTACEAIGLPLLDHIIIGSDGPLGLAEHGVL